MSGRWAVIATISIALISLWGCSDKSANPRAAASLNEQNAPMAISAALKAMASSDAAASMNLAKVSAAQAQQSAALVRFSEDIMAICRPSLAKSAESAGPISAIVPCENGGTMNAQVETTSVPQGTSLRTKIIATNCEMNDQYMDGSADVYIVTGHANRVEITTTRLVHVDRVTGDSLNLSNLSMTVVTSADSISITISGEISGIVDSKPIQLNASNLVVRTTTTPFSSVVSGSIYSYCLNGWIDVYVKTDASGVQVRATAGSDTAEVSISAGTLTVMLNGNPVSSYASLDEIEQLCN